MIRWQPDAADDLDRVLRFLLERNAAAVHRAVQTIQEGLDRLDEYPELGHSMGDRTDRREVYLPFGAGAYVLRYKITRDAIVVLRIWHSREEC